MVDGGRGWTWIARSHERPPTNRLSEWREVYSPHMRYATFSLSNDPAPRLGVVLGDRILDVGAAFGGRWTGDVPDTLLSLIQQGPDAWPRLRDLCSDDGHSGRASHAISAI